MNTLNSLSPQGHYEITVVRKRTKDSAYPFKTAYRVRLVAENGKLLNHAAQPFNSQESAIENIVQTIRVPIVGIQEGAESFVMVLVYDKANNEVFWLYPDGKIQMLDIRDIQTYQKKKIFKP